MAKKLVEYLREIKRLNERFRKLVDRLAERKDALMDEMQAQCPHPKAFGTFGTRLAGPMLICRACGMVESNTFPKLSAAKITLLENEVYLVEQGKLLKKLGFNL